MNQGPVSCLPMNSRMSKVKKALDEARETQTRELDLVDKNVSSFDEMSGLRKSIYHFSNSYEHLNMVLQFFPVSMENQVIGRSVYTHKYI